MRHFQTSLQKVHARSGLARLYKTIVREGKMLVLALGVAGCSALDVNSPTTIRVSDIDNPDGARAFLNGIYGNSWIAMIAAISSAGSLSDEFLGGNYGGYQLWQRDDATYQAWLHEPGNSQGDVYSRIQKSWISAAMAIPKVAASGTSEQLGEAYALRGFFMIHLAELICPGFPVADIKIDGEAMSPLFTSDPQTTDSAFLRALADEDTALGYITSAGPVNSFAKVLRARALLGLGRFAEAEVAASTVPTEFADTIFSPRNLSSTFRDGLPVQNRKGTNGLDFVTAQDPRLVLIDQYNDGTKFQPQKYSVSSSSEAIIVASGIEARLIEAEAQLATGNSAWLTTLNTLRGTVGMVDTTDPGTDAGRVDLIMRERAFWLFGTAHRLGDLRRLMRLYGRDSETIFPIGEYDEYSPYGTATSISFNGDFEHLFNPKITGCTGP